MNIRIKLMGMLKARTPPNEQLELQEHDTITSVLDTLGIPTDSVQVFTVNGDLERDKARVLQEGDELVVLPPVGGG